MKITSVRIPLLSDRADRWEMQADLSGRRYGFYISWNSRMGAWFMAVSDSAGALLIAGIRLACGAPFLRKYRASAPDLPPGELWLADLEGSGAEVTRDNLHKRFALTYMVVERGAHGFRTGG